MKNYFTIFSLLTIQIFTLNAQRGDWYLYSNPGVVYDMAQDSTGVFHLATNNGYTALNTDLTVADHVTLFNNMSLNTSDFRAIAIHPNSKNLWFCTGNGKILEKTGNVFSEVTYNPIKPYSEFTNLWIASSGEIIVKGAWADSGLHVMSQTGWEKLEVEGVNDFVEGENGLWYFGTAQNGVKTYDKVTKLWSTLPNSPIGTTEWVSDLLVDSVSKSLFIATNSNGIFEYKTDSSSVQYYDFSLSGISSIFKEADTMHVTHLGYAYSKCVLPTNTWTNYNPSNSNMPDNWLYSAYPVNGGVLLKPSGAVFKYSPADNSTSTLILNEDEVDFHNFRKIEVRKVGAEMQFFGTTYNDGLVVKLGDQKFQNFTTNNSILTSMAFNDLDLDSSGTIWVSTSDGLYSVDKSMIWTKFDVSNSQGFLTSNNVKQFALGRAIDDTSMCAVQVQGDKWLNVARGLPGAIQSFTPMDSSSSPEFSENVTAFDFKSNSLLVGFSKGAVLPVAFPNPNLGISFGVGNQIMSDSSKVDEINSLAFSAGLKPEYHFTNFFSVHSEVGFVFALVEHNSISNSISSGGEIGTAIEDFEQIGTGTAGFTFWFKRVTGKESYLFGYDKDAAIPLQYVDVNDVNNVGGIEITDLNLSPTIYSIIATPVSKDTLAIYLNTSMGLLVNRNVLLEPATTSSASEHIGKISLFPNPVEATLHIEGVGDNVDYTIFDVSGKQLFKGKGNIVDVSKLDRGVYLIQIAKMETIKFIKK